MNNIKGILTTLAIADKVGRGFRVAKEQTFNGFALASYFPDLHGSHYPADRRIINTPDFKPVGLTKYLRRNYDGGLDGPKTRMASYIYNLEAPGSYCIFVWDFADEESAKLVDAYFSKHTQDTCGDYIYGKLYHTLSVEEQKKYADVFEY